MREYQSHKVVKATKINAAERHPDGGWGLSCDDPDVTHVATDEANRFRITEEDLGYLVEYADGYRSWSPTAAFEEGYTLVSDLPKVTKGSTDLSFGDALELLKVGLVMAREGWSGKGMWVVLVYGTPPLPMTEGTVYHKAGLRKVAIDPHIDMFNADGRMQPGWLASQADMLANDWMIVGGEADGEA